MWPGAGVHPPELSDILPTDACRKTNTRGFGGVSEQRATTLSGDFRRGTPVVVAATADVRQCAAVLVYAALFYFIPTPSNYSLFVSARKRGTELSRAYNSVCCSETGRE